VPIQWAAARPVAWLDAAYGALYRRRLRRFGDRGHPEHLAAIAVALCAGCLLLGLPLWCDLLLSTNLRGFLVRSGRASFVAIFAIISVCSHVRYVRSGRFESESRIRSGAAKRDDLVAVGFVVGSFLTFAIPVWLLAHR